MPTIIPFDDAAVPLIAAELGVPARLARYRVRGAPVYELTLRNAHLSAPVRVTLWPSLARVDVRAGDTAIAYKGIADVAIFRNIEVTFRRPGGHLFLTRDGKIAAVMPE